MATNKVVHGTSLGGAVAVDLTSRNPTKVCSVPLCLLFLFRCSRSHSIRIGVGPHYREYVSFCPQDGPPEDEAILRLLDSPEMGFSLQNS